MKKKITVIMGVYNCEATLIQSIESIINQTTSDWELIMCDDGSIDTSYTIAKDYEKRNSSIKVIRNDKNMGLAFSLNRCLEIAEGKYIARMDADDIALPNRLEKQMDYLDNNENVGILGSNVYYFDEYGVWGKSQFDSVLEKHDICRGNTFNHPSVMIRKCLLEEVNGYESNQLTYRAEDYDLWCKLYEKGAIGHVLDSALLKYRLDKNAYKKRKYKYRIDEFRLKKYWANRYKIPFINRFYVIKPLLIGLIPSPLMQRYHRYSARLKVG